MATRNLCLILVLFLYGCGFRIEPIPPVEAAPLSTKTSRPTMIPTSTKTPRPTVTPRPTITPMPPCPPDETPMQIGEFKVYMHAGVTPADCDFFATFVGKTLDWIREQGVSIKPAEIHVFANAIEATDIEHELARLAGCNPDSKEVILRSWGGSGGHTTLGAAFFVVEGWWDSQWNYNERVVAIAHEIVHIIQGQYAGSCPRLWQAPDWIKEGHAHYIGRLLATLWGRTPVDYRSSLLNCEFTLAQLVSGTNCIYMQGEQAFILLAHDYPNVGVFAFWEQFGKGKSANTAFYDAYKTSVFQFSADFDVFRAAEYPTLVGGDE